MAENYEFSAATVLAVTGLTYRQLHNMAATDTCCPTRMEAGSGSQWLYTYDELVALTAIKLLDSLGARASHLRRAVYRSLTSAKQNERCRVTTGDDTVVITVDKLRAQKLVNERLQELQAQKAKENNDG